MTAPAAEWAPRDAAAHVRLPDADDDKYRRGVLGMRTGSEAYPGAAVLGVEAACRTGVGMVRYLGPSPARELVLLGSQLLAAVHPNPRAVDAFHGPPDRRRRALSPRSLR